MGRFLKALGNFIVDITKPSSFVKGDEFETHVREYMFPKKNYDLVQKTHDYKTNKSDFVESSLNPDYKFRDKKTGKEFWVECKFREGVIEKGKIFWCTKNQLKRYKTIHKNLPVFIVLGIGDSASLPDEVILFSVSEVNWTGLYESFLDKHSFYLDKPVFSSFLWKMIKK